MKRTRKPISALTNQMKDKAGKKKIKSGEYDGSTEMMISTGSTLLDLAISGGRVRGGGIPGGILVEAFGPNSSGKTVLLCEIAGDVQRHEGSVMFHDPEARLNKQFAQMFDLDTDNIDYTTPNTIPEVFTAVRKWEPDNKNINGVFADSLAALSTDMEMKSDDGDKMGMRRAKEFSEELRKTCRVIKEKNLLMVCSNQVRINVGGGEFAPRYVTPGGEAIGFYSSLRLQFSSPTKLKEKKTVKGKDITKIIGVKTDITVIKSSVWEPYHSAPIFIQFDYGIDDIRANLQFVKDFTGNTVYAVNGNTLSKSMKEATAMVEDQELVNELMEETIDLWETIQRKFKTERKPKR